MRIHTKIALAGIVGTTALGLISMNETAEAKTLNVTADNSVVLNKNNVHTEGHDICSDVVQLPSGGK